MQWWTDFLDWLNSDTGGRIVSTVVVPFVAIVVAGIVAALIGRASARKVIELSEREVRASAVTALISAARKAAVWNTLPAPEQQHIDHLIGDAEIRLRLLPIAGTALAADWARHEIAGMKRNAISFSFQAEQSLLVFRDRLIEWQGRPSRAKKLFKNDLDSWAYDSSASEQELVHQQQKWAAQQVTETGPISTVTTTPFTRPPSPAPITAPLVESTTTTSAAAGVAAGSLAAGLAAAAAPDAETVATEVAPPQAAVPDAVAPAAVAPEPVAPSPAPEPAAPETRALVEPVFSSPGATVPEADEPHPLVEPADTSHDVSEASIFGGRGPQEAAESKHDAPGDSGQVNPEPERVDAAHYEAAHSESAHSESDRGDRESDHGDSGHTQPEATEPASSETEVIEGELVEPDGDHESPSGDSGHDEHHNHDDHEHHDGEHEHRDHDEHQHDEWRG